MLGRYNGLGFWATAIMTGTEALTSAEQAKRQEERLKQAQKAEQIRAENLALKKEEQREEFMRKVKYGLAIGIPVVVIIGIIIKELRE